MHNLEVSESQRTQAKMERFYETTGRRLVTNSALQKKFQVLIKLSQDDIAAERTSINLNNEATFFLQATEWRIWMFQVFFLE